MATQKEKIEAWKNAMIESAKKIYNQDQELMPVAMLYIEDKETMIIGMPFSNQKEKEISCETLKQIIRQNKAIAVLFIYEGYMLKIPIEDNNKIFREDGTKMKSIKDTEGRTEVVFMTFESKAGDTELTTIEINDKKLGKQTTSAGVKSQGLFSNFFATPVWVN